MKLKKKVMTICVRRKLSKSLRENDEMEEVCLSVDPFH